MADAQRGGSNEWRFYGGDAGSSIYSPLDQINAANVGQLREAWRWSSPDNAIAAANSQAQPGTYEDTPLMANGVVPTFTGLGVIAAIEPGTGKTIWQFDAETWKLGRPTNLGFLHRGTLVLDRRHRRAALRRHSRRVNLISVDAKSGKLDTAFGTGGRVDLTEQLAFVERIRNYTVTSAPVVVHNVAISGAGISDGPQQKEMVRGDVSGFHLRSGERLWTFHSVPQPGEFGNDSWDGDAAEYTGNTNVWSLMSVDETLGYVYLPFGTPTNDYYGGHRLGNNLFAESLVCLDATTGKRVWHFQAVHHGLWDYDFPAAPTLGTITVDRRQIDVVMQISRQAFVYCSIAGPASRCGRSRSARSRRPRSPAKDVADAAVPHQAASLRSSGVRRCRRDCVHAGDQGTGARADQAVRPRPVVHSAVDGRDDPAARQRRRWQLERRVVRSGDSDALRSINHEPVPRPAGAAARCVEKQHAAAPQWSGGDTDARRAATGEASLQPHHRLRHEYRDHCLAGAARGRPPDASALEGAQPAAARRRPRLRCSPARCCSSAIAVVSSADRRRCANRRPCAPSTRRPARRSRRLNCHSARRRR